MLQTMLLEPRCSRPRLIPPLVACHDLSLDRVGIREEGGRYLADVLKKKIGLKELRCVQEMDTSPTGVKRR